MEKKLKVDPKGQTMLSPEEMRCITGGSITETVAKLALSGMQFFGNMGIKEAKRMKALL